MLNVAADLVVCQLRGREATKSRVADVWTVSADPVAMIDRLDTSIAQSRMQRKAANISLVATINVFYTKMDEFFRVCFVRSDLRVHEPEIPIQPMDEDVKNVGPSIRHSHQRKVALLPAAELDITQLSSELRLVWIEVDPCPGNLFRMDGFGGVKTSPDKSSRFSRAPTEAAKNPMRDDSGNKPPKLA